MKQKTINNLKLWGATLLASTMLFTAGFIAGRSIAQDTETVIYEPVSTPAVITEAPQPESLGQFKVTYYCPCATCCGEWADGITASGTQATPGRTVAANPQLLPYGSEILVRFADGTEEAYIVEDTGSALRGQHIDIFMDSHDAALAEGVKTAEVFLIEGVE